MNSQFTAKIHSKNIAQSLRFKAQWILCGALLSLSCSVSAAPVGGQIIGGQGSISQSGLTTQINQSTHALAIDWSSFNVQQNEIVNFLQPNASSIALNRIIGGSASDIHGQINANGQVILVNPNGLFFGANSSVNVGSFIASGLDINTADFMNADTIFKSVDGSSGTVINAGLLKASLGGSITLLGKQVKNEGLISANLGSVNLAAGHEAILTFDSVGLLGVKVSKAILQDELGVDPALINNGDIQAAGGRVLLTASQSQDIFSSVVNTGAIQQATSVVVHEDGSFTLGGGSDVINAGSIDVSTSSHQHNAGQVVVLGDNVTSSGHINANALNAQAGMVELHSTDTILLTQNSTTTARTETNGSGGQVKVLGNFVGLTDQSMIDVSGELGGGEVLIGGDFQGKNNQIRNAQRTFVGEKTVIKANAVENGDGGTVIVWADESTQFYGDISAQGGVSNGDGGFSEVSGKQGLVFSGFVDLSADFGEGGMLLLDPRDITINGGTTTTLPVVDFSLFSDNSALVTVLNVDDLRTLLTNNPVTLQANNNITLDIDLINAANNGLTLHAGHSIFINNNISLDHGSFTAVINHSGATLVDRDGGNAVFTMASGTSINTNRDNISITTDNHNNLIGDITLQTLSTSDGANTGSIIITNSVGNIDVDGSITTNSSNNDAGNITITALNGILTIDSSISSEGDNDNDDFGGDIGLSANSIVINQSISANSGDDAGSITITSNVGDVVVDGSITSNSSRDDGGAINLTATNGNLIINSLISSNGAGGSNDDGGNITFLSNGFTLAASITSNGDTEGDISISGDLLDNIFNFNSGSSFSANSTMINTLAGNDTVNINTDITADFNGGADNDSFVFDPTLVTITGTIDGTSGNNELDFSSTVGALNLDFGAVFDGTLNINQVVGNGSDSTLSASNNVANTWTIDGTNSGMITDGADTVIFSGMTQLNGGSDVDTFDIGASGSIANSINGGDDNDVFNFANTGSFIGTINGDNQDDQFVFTASGSLVDTINGGSNSDTYNISLLGAVTIDISTLSFIESIVGNDVTSSILGTNTDNTWTISSGNDGTFLDNDNSISINFTDFVNLTGGTSTDVFNFDALSSVSGLIDGGVGTDSYDVSAHAGPINVQIGIDITSIEDIAGNNTNSTLTAANIANTWTILGADDGIINGISFSNFNTLTGGNNTDSYAFSSNSNPFSGSIDGGLGTDAFDFSSSSGNIDLTSIFNSSSNIDQIIGNNNNSTLIAGNNANTWAIDGTNDGSVASIDFFNFGNLTGGADTDDFIFTGTGSISGDIDGGADTDSYDASSSSSITLDLSNITSIESFIGNNTDSTFIATSANNIWSITGDNDGTVNDGVSTIAFTNFNKLTGGSGAGSDDFTFTGLGAISGLIDGGSGTDSYVASSIAGPITIQIGTNVSSIENIVGNNLNSTLSASNVANTWTVDGSNNGTLGAVTFSGFNTITGGTNTDSFAFSSNSNPFVGILNGGLGTDTFDFSSTSGAINLTTILSGSTSIEQIIGNNNSSTLVAANVVNTWAINGANDGIVASIAFFNFGNLTGGTAADSFNFTGAGSISGLINGGAGTDSYDASSSSSISLDLTNITSIESFIGNNTDSTLIAKSANNTWSITGVNDGTVNDGVSTIAFTNFNKLTGGSGTGTDNFNFTGLGAITGLIDGGGGTDSYNAASIVGPISIQIGVDVTSIESIVGNNINSTLIAANVANIWGINGSNNGTLGTATFSGFNTITGGTSTDSFGFGSNANPFIGSINGGLGTDAFDFSSSTGAINLTTTFTGSSSIEQIIGNNNNSTLVAGNVVNTWAINGANDGTVASVAFFNFGNLIGGTTTDAFSLTGAGSISGVINGGAGTDSYDVSSLAGPLSVQIGDDVTAIESLIGNNTNSTLTASNTNNIWSITGNNDGTINDGINTIAFTNFNNVIGGSANDAFNFTGLGLITSLINGGSGTDAYDASSATAISLNLANILSIESFLGNNTNSTIIANNTNNTWTITGVNDGTVSDGSSTIAFTNFNHLTGGSASDDFSFSAAGLLTGVMDGSLGADTLNASALAGVLNVQLGVNVLSIEDVTGNNTNSTFTSTNTNNTWTINGNNDGVFDDGTDQIVFTDFANLTGGTGTDDFNFINSGSISGLINGGNGTDSYDASASISGVTLNLANITSIESIVGNNTNSTLIATNVINTWAITNENDGAVGAFTFTDFNNLTGGTLVDSFVFTGSGSVTGIVDGGAGTDQFDMSALAGAVAVELEIDVTSIEQIIGNGINSTLIATNNNNLWSINGDNDGSIGAVSFVDFDNLTGGSSADNFVYTGAGAISGLVDGGLGTDSYDISGLAGTVTVALNTDITSIESIDGNNTDTTLIATNTNNTWTIIGANAGTLDDGIGLINFTNINKLTGGTGIDNFIFTNNGLVDGAISGLINGGAGNDIYDASGLSGTVSVLLGTDVASIEQIIGNGINSTLIGTNVNNTWTISSDNDGSIGAIAFVDFNNLTGGSATDDFNMTLDGSQNGSINLSGEGGNDSLNISGGHANYVETYEANILGFDQLSYVQSGNAIAINYKLIESIQDDATVAELVINGSTLNDTINLDSLNFQMGTQLAVGYDNKDSMTINGLGGTDVIEIIGNVSITDTVTLNAETIGNAGNFLLTADALILESVGNAGLNGSEIRTDINTLALQNVTGDVFVEEQNGLSLGQSNTLGTIELDVLAGNVSQSGALTSLNNINIDVTSGDIVLDQSNQLSGEISLLASNGDIILTNTASSLLDDINAQNLSVTSSGVSDTATGLLNVSVSSIFDGNNADIILDNTGHIFTDLSVTNTSNLTLVDSNAAGLSINNINASNQVDITSSAAISDSNGVNTNIAANSIILRSDSGIDLDTQTSMIDIENSNSGSVNLENIGTMEIVSLKNMAAVGNIDIRTTGDYRLNPGSVVANNGELVMFSSGGGFLGLGSTPDFTNVDIAADIATFTAINGSFGSFTRPIVLDIRTTVTIQTRTSFEPLFAAPLPIILDQSLLQFSGVATQNAVAGEQIVELETLAEIDPAIFTDLQNFSMEQIPLLLPRDQLFEDELEELDKRL